MRCLLVVVGSATDVFMVPERTDCFGGGDGRELEPPLEQGFDELAARGGAAADGERTCARGVEASSAVALASADDAQHRSVAHLGPWVRRQRHLCDARDAWTQRSCPRDQSL